MTPTEPREAPARPAESLSGCIYHDNGAAFGRRTRVFRNAPGGGVEWMYAADYAGPAPRWYGYMATGRHETIGSLIASGMELSRFDSADPAQLARPEPITELTPAGEQTVIPGCERNASPKATQLDLFG